MNRNFRHFRNYGLGLGLFFLLVITAGCQSIGDGYDDPINIRTFKTTHDENNYFQKYFRAYINRITGDDLVGIYSETRSARYTMKVTVLDRESGKTEHKKIKNTSGGNRIPDQGPYIGYSIKIDMVDNKNGGLVWSWAPDKWRGYSTEQKSIKWLAKYSSKRMVRAGLFGSKYLN